MSYGTTKLSASHLSVPVTISCSPRYYTEVTQTYPWGRKILVFGIRKIELSDYVDELTVPFPGPNGGTYVGAYNKYGDFLKNKSLYEIQHNYIGTNDLTNEGPFNYDPPALRWGELSWTPSNPEYYYNTLINLEGFTSGSSFSGYMRVIKSYSTSSIVMFSTPVEIPTEFGYLLGYKPYGVKSKFTLTCTTEPIPVEITPTVTVNIGTLEIPWVANESYTIEAGEGFVKHQYGDAYDSPSFTVPYTANPPLDLESTIPVNNDLAVITNDYFKLNFLRKVKPFLPGNIYLYEVSQEQDTLIHTIPINTDLINDSETITLDIRGRLKADTSYYIKIDENTLEDADHFLYGGISTKTELAFTTAGQPFFPDLAGLLMSSGTMTSKAMNLRGTLVSANAIASEVARPISTRRARATISAMASALNVGVRVKIFRSTISSQATVWARIGKSISANYGDLNLYVDATNNTLSTRIKQLSAEANASVSTTINGMCVTPFESSTVAAFSIICNADKTQVAMIATLGSMLVSPNAYYRPSSAMPAIVNTRCNAMVYINEGPQYTISSYSGLGNLYSGLSMNDNYLLIGEISSSINNYIGNAKLIDLASGLVINTFSEPGLASSYFYGSTVAVTDNYSFVSAPHLPTGTVPSYSPPYGRVYMYDNVSGNLVRTFDNPMPSNYFGGAIYATDTTVSISVYNEGYPFGTTASRVVTYDIDTGDIILNIIPSPLDPYFASDVSGNGSTLAVANGYAGGRYVKFYNSSTGELNRTIDGTGLVNFGKRVAINSTYAIIPYFSATGSTGLVNAGKALVYDIATGNLVYSFEGEVAEAYASQYVAIDERYAYMYASRDFSTNLTPGVVYVYDLSDGSLAHKLISPNLTGDNLQDFFGRNIASNGTFVATSAPGDGYVYVYRLLP